MMLIYDALKKDHRDLRHLLKQLEASSEKAGARREELLAQFSRTLIAHIKAEESVLYDTLKELNETEDLALEACEEHHVLLLLLRELEAVEASDERWRAKFTVLKDNLEHHTDAEESEIFALARQVLTQEESRMMAEALTRLKADVSQGSSLESAMDKITGFLPTKLSCRYSQLTRRM